MSSATAVSGLIHPSFVPTPLDEKVQDGLAITPIQRFTPFSQFSPITHCVFSKQQQDPGDQEGGGGDSMSLGSVSPFLLVSSTDAKSILYRIDYHFIREQQQKAAGPLVYVEQLPLVHTHSILAADFNCDNTKIATAGVDMFVAIFSFDAAATLSSTSALLLGDEAQKSKTTLLTRISTTDVTLSLSFSPNVADTLAVGSASGTVSFFDVNNNGSETSLPIDVLHTGQDCCATLSWATLDPSQRFIGDKKFQKKFRREFRSKQPETSSIILSSSTAFRKSSSIYSYYDPEMNKNFLTCLNLSAGKNDVTESTTKTSNPEEQEGEQSEKQKLKLQLRKSERDFVRAQPQARQKIDSSGYAVDAVAIDSSHGAARIAFTRNNVSTYEKRRFVQVSDIASGRATGTFQVLEDSSSSSSSYSSSSSSSKIENRSIASLCFAHKSRAVLLVVGAGGNLSLRSLLPVPPIMRNHGYDTRSRLEAFFNKYNPGNLDKIDMIMEKFAGKEDVLFEKLVQKYGEEPPRLSKSDADSSSSSSSDCDGEDQFGTIKKSKDAESRRKRKEAREAKKKKKQEEEEAKKKEKEDAEKSILGSKSYKVRVKRICEKYCPEQVANIDLMMAKYYGREEELVKALCQKYIGTSQEPPPTQEEIEEERKRIQQEQQRKEKDANLTPEQLAIKRQYDRELLRARIVRFYRHYQPFKSWDQIEQLVNHGEINPEVLFSELVQRFGPEDFIGFDSREKGCNKFGHLIGHEWKVVATKSEEQIAREKEQDKKLKEELKRKDPFNYFDSRADVSSKMTETVIRTCLFSPDDRLIVAGLQDGDLVCYENPIFAARWRARKVLFLAKEKGKSKLSQEGFHLWVVHKLTSMFLSLG